MRLQGFGLDVLRIFFADYQLIPEKARAGLNYRVKGLNIALLF